MPTRPATPGELAVAIALVRRKATPVRRRPEAVRASGVKATFAAIRATGAHVRREDGEWRVNLPGGTEATAYYTTDSVEAVATALDMMTEHRRWT